MPTTISRFSRVAYRAAIMFALVATACNDSTEPSEEDEPEVASVRLAVGAQTVSISETGTVTGGPLRVAVGANTITATFFKADGSPETRVNETDFEVRITSTAAANVAFTRTGAFAGTLTITGLAVGATSQLSVSLFHKIEGHDDFGPFTVPLQVQ